MSSASESLVLRARLEVNIAATEHRISRSLLLPDYHSLPELLFMPLNQLEKGKCSHSLTLFLFWFTHFLSHLLAFFVHSLHTHTLSLFSSHTRSPLFLSFCMTIRILTISSYARLALPNYWQKAPRTSQRI